MPEDRRVAGAGYPAGRRRTLRCRGGGARAHHAQGGRRQDRENLRLRSNQKIHIGSAPRVSSPQTHHRSSRIRGLQHRAISPTGLTHRPFERGRLRHQHSAIAVPLRICSFSCVFVQLRALVATAAPESPRRGRFFSLLAARSLSESSSDTLDGVPFDRPPTLQPVVEAPRAARPQRSSSENAEAPARRLAAATKRRSTESAEGTEQKCRCAK
jgi:hypothetical protein